MAVEFTSASASSGKNGTGASFTFTSFAISGTNPVVLVGIAVADATATISSVVVSAGLTSSTPVQVKTIRQGASFISIWAIPAPSGTGTITVNLSASVAWQAQAALFANSDQTTPSSASDAVTFVAAIDVASTSGVQTPANLTANDASFAFACNTQASDVVGVTPNQTYLDDSTTVNAEGGYNTGTAGITANWGDNNGNKAMVTVRIVAASGGGETITVDKWFSAAKDPIRRRRGVVASGTVGIKS